ncbi:MAG: serine/threonine-protein kinase, partial [Chloroflexota bacterium]
MAASKAQCETRHYYVGATIDERYDLTDFIGAGGMACVYKASERDTPHTYAIKFLKSEYHNMDYLVEYFESEASSMVKLAHPNIVRLYRFVNREDYSYILMDYVDGFALSDVISLSKERRRHMPIDEVVRVMTQIARALDAIHREDFVHRDIKPSNVLIDRTTGQAFLTDLGIASTKDTIIKGAGTLAYMAPEQAETWKADQRSDIYAYGILVFEMLTMTRPFKGNKELSGTEAEADLLRKHREEPVPKVTDYRRDLPKAINDVIAKAMAKEPANRYASVVEFAQDVHQVLLPKLSPELNDFTSIEHRKIAAPDSESASSGNRNTTQLLIGVTIAALIFAGLIAFGTFFNTAPPVPTVEPITDTPPATFTPTPAPTADPLEGAFRGVFLTGASVLSEPSSTDPVAVQPAEGLPLQFMRIGMVNGFSVEMELASTTGLTRYGIAFRVQDERNYHYFAVNPATFGYEIGVVADGVATAEIEGLFETLPTRFTLSGIDNYFELSAAQLTIPYISDTYPTGSLAILIEGDPEAEMVFQRLQINFVGDAALAAVRTSPTPSEGIGDPFRLLRQDVTALLATNNASTFAVDCAPYIEVYETLDRHLDNPNSEVVATAQDIQTIGDFVYSRCSDESPSSELSFVGFLDEYGD